MPPDPIGHRSGLSSIIASDHPVIVDDIDDEGYCDWYDRSSLRGDFMVMIAGQTEADYLRRAPTGRFCEFIDGIVYMPPSVLPDHQFDLLFLSALVACYNARRPIGVVQAGPAILKLRDGCLLEPDLFVLPLGTKAQIRADGLSHLPALLVVEVLSPSNRSHDLTTKSVLYREAEVAEIWFVDRRDRVLISERLEEGRYVLERFESGPVESRSLPGFWFDAAWLWAEPEPNLLDCLDLILAGPPRV